MTLKSLYNPSCNTDVLSNLLQGNAYLVRAEQVPLKISLQESNASNGGFYTQNCEGVRRFLKFQLSMSKFGDQSTYDFLMVSCSETSAQIKKYSSALYKIQALANTSQEESIVFDEFLHVSSSSGAVWQTFDQCGWPMFLVNSEGSSEPSGVHTIRQGANGIFEMVQIQTFMTAETMHTEVMKINGQTIVAVNYYANSSNNVSSHVYSLDCLVHRKTGIDVDIKLLQEFETQGARTMTHLAFSAQNSILLAVAHEKGNKVSLMKWEEDAMQFSVVGSHVLLEPTYLVSWVGGEDGDVGFGFIAAGSSVGDTVILRVDSNANIVVVQSLATGPVNALSVFTGRLQREPLSNVERCLLVAVRERAGESAASSEIHCSSHRSGLWIRHFIIDTKETGALELISLDGARYMLSGNGWGRDMEVHMIAYPICA
jgi:hypothetical protein